MKLVIGIESSCDDTCLGIIDENNKILCNFSASQNESHIKYKGVVPEIAARMHSKNISYLAKKAFDLFPIENIKAIAATSGPGLIGGLITGTTFAKTLSSILKIPFIGVNHLQAHALTIEITNKEIQYPYLVLLASGGHCQFIAVLGFDTYIVLGSTKDDSVGEVFDKLAIMMNLSYPGGPIIEKKAKNGRIKKYNMPKPMFNTKCCNMSFSGLKTHLKLLISNLKELNEEIISDICACFQHTIAYIFEKKCQNAIKTFNNILIKKKIYPKKNYFVFSGGVASNLFLRKRLQNSISNSGFNFLCPPVNLCTDNGAMIAYTGMRYFKANKFSDIKLKPMPKWHINQTKLNN